MLYPLAVGNRWHYSRIFTLDFHGLGADTFHISTDRVITGTQTSFDRVYFVEEETSTEDERPGEVFRSRTLYRQDRTGLFVSTADQSGTSKASKVDLEAAPISDLESRRQEILHSIDLLRGAARRPGGAASGEVTYLPYPLHVGKSWHFPTNATLTWTVDGVEMLVTPAGRFPAYRIRASHPLDGPEDYTHIWFSRAGYLGYRLHVVVPTGYPGAGWTGDETEFVDQLSISR